MSPLLIIVSFFIFLEDGFPIFFLQKRVGVNNSFFKIYKFRTMLKGTPDIPTHLLKKKSKTYTKIGPFLRKYSIDELPQIINIIKGDMKFIGPRPALYNQYDLIELRNKSGVEKLFPGITGWAQVNGRDNISLAKKNTLDRYYLENKSILLDIKIIFLTIIKVFKKEGVIH